METKELKKEIMGLISKVTETDIKRVDVKVSFMKGLNVDSLMALEIVSALEKKYKIEIKEEDFPNLATIDDTVALVEQRLKETHEKTKDKKASSKQRVPKQRLNRSKVVKMKKPKDSNG